MPSRKELRLKFREMADGAFDAMFDGDQQEQLITMTQREDRVLQKGAELQSVAIGAAFDNRSPGESGRGGRAVARGT